MRYVASNDEGMADTVGSTVTHDSTNNKYDITYTVEFGAADWRQLPGCIHRNLTALRLLKRVLVVRCFVWIDGEPNEWTIQYRDQAGGL